MQWVHLLVWLDAYSWIITGLRSFKLLFLDENMCEWLQDEINKCLATRGQPKTRGGRNVFIPVKSEQIWLLTKCIILKVFNYWITSRSKRKRFLQYCNRVWKMNVRVRFLRDYLIIMLIIKVSQKLYSLLGYNQFKEDLFERFRITVILYTQLCSYTKSTVAVFQPNRLTICERVCSFFGSVRCTVDPSWPAHKG